MQAGLIKKAKLEEKSLLVDVKFTHSLCIGQTGSGKTSSFIYPNLVRRLQLGHGILFFDIKGNEHKAIKKLAKDAGRLDDVIEIGKPWGKNINIVTSFNSRTFGALLKKIIKIPEDGGQNSFFYNAAFSLGMSIFQIIKTSAIISQEITEIGANRFPIASDFTRFTLNDVYKACVSIDAIYNFLQIRKDFAQEVFEFLKINAYLYRDSKKQDLYENIAVNYSALESLLKDLEKYDVPPKERSSSSKFENALLSVVSTLSEGFGFMISPAGSYISEIENPIDIVERLQEAKVIIINVRVIPDGVLELMLENIFEKMIDLNLLSEEKRHPTSVFIDEAQRLINKNIPLDVLRSSKVDVVMAVQSEIQLISKFQSEADWQQISANISQKYAFRSAFFGGSHLVSFYADTGNLNTFEYVKEYSSITQLAQPIFLAKDDLEAVELEYQHKVLQLGELKKHEFYQYDVTHFESEREIIVYNAKTKKKHYQKLLTPMQKGNVFLMLKEYIPMNPDQLREEMKYQKSPSKPLLKKICDELDIKTLYAYKKFFQFHYDNYEDLCNSIIKKGANIWDELVFRGTDSSTLLLDIFEEEKDDEKSVETMIVKDILLEVVSINSAAIKSKIAQTLKDYDLMVYEEPNGELFIFANQDFIDDTKDFFEGDVPF